MMPVISRCVTRQMHGDSHIENITEDIQELVANAGLHSGVITLFVKHTTASLFIMEDEPGLRADTYTMWNQMVSADPAWKHNTKNPGEDNGHSHLRAQLQGSSLTIPFIDATVTLGTWQQIVMIDFDTQARIRQIIVQIMGE